MYLLMMNTWTENTWTENVRYLVKTAKGDKKIGLARG